MKRKYYSANEMLTLSKAGHDYLFKICGEVGHGTMAVGYDAIKIADKQIDAEVGDRKVMLFQYCPDILEKGSDAYEFERNRFIDALRLQCSLGNDERTVNQTAPIIETYDDNTSGALWVETTWKNAVTLSSLTPENTSLLSFFKTISHLLDAIAGYHECGYLMLSLKPQNVQVYVEGYGVEGVRLLNFGGMIEKEVLQDEKKRRGNLVSFNKKWSAPELKDQEFEIISEKADVYSIGLIIYSFLFEGKLPEKPWELSKTINEDLAFVSALSKTANNSAKIRSELAELILGMLEYYPDDRISEAQAKESADRIIDELHLESIKQICRPDRLRSVIPKTAKWYIAGSRKPEETAILELIEDFSPFIIVQGAGGVGKSELVLDLARKKSREYDFYYLTYNGESILRTLLQLPLYPPLKTTKTLEDGQKVSLTEEEMYGEVIKCLQACGRETVLIIDNLDAPDDNETYKIQEQKEYRDLIELPITVIATSRFGGFEGASIVHVGEDYDICYKLIRKYLSETDEEILAELINAVDRNTLAVDIIGRLLSDNTGFGAGVTEEALLETLSERPRQRRIKELRRKRAGEEIDTVDYLSHIFDSAEIGEAAEKVLRFASLFPVNGILKTLASGSLTTAEGKKSLTELIKSGWIREKRVGETFKVYIHPIVNKLIERKMTADDRRHTLFLYLPKFAESFGNHVEAETDGKNKYPRLFEEDLAFAEGFAKFASDEIMFGTEAPTEAAESAAKVYRELSQHYYHRSDRSDLRKRYLSKAVDLMRRSLAGKQGGARAAAELELASTVFYRGIACYNLDQFDLFLTDCDNALSLMDPIEGLNEKGTAARDRLMAQIYQRKGELLLGQGDRRAALDNYEKAIDIAARLDGAELARAYRFKGIALGDGGQLVEALKLFKLAIDNNDLLMRAYNCVGLYCSTADLYEIALENYERAYSSWEDDKRFSPVFLYINMANCCSELGRFEEAKKWVEGSICELFHADSREAADEMIKLLEPDTREVDIHISDPHWQGTLASFVSMCALKLICARDGEKVNRSNARILAERAVSSCDDAINGLYYDLIAGSVQSEESIRARASKLSFNKQTAAYLFNRLGEYFALIGEYTKAYRLALAGYQLNVDYNYPIGIAASAEHVKKAAKALSLPVSKEIIELGDKCGEMLKKEKTEILKLRHKELCWLFCGKEPER